MIHGAQNTFLRKNRLTRWHMTICWTYFSFQVFQLEHGHRTFNHWFRIQRPQSRQRIISHNLSHRSCLFICSNLVKKHLQSGGILFLSFFLLGTSIPYPIPNLPLVDFMEGSYLCLSLFLNSPLLFPKAHMVGWKCFQVLLLLQSNSSFILSICEILRKELPGVSTAILLPCDL